MGRLLDEDTIIKVLEHWKEAFKENSHHVSASDLSLVIKDVKELPSVQPEPQEGHWIPHESPDGGEQYECSRCGVLWEFNDGAPEDNEAYFCPNCGAKMKGAKHETD